MTIPYIKHNKIYFIKKSPEEPTEHFYLRCNFIASQEPGTQDVFNICVVYSHIYINNTLYGSEYNDSIMQKLENMKKNIYSN